MSVPECVQCSTFGLTYLPWLASSAGDDEAGELVAVHRKTDRLGAFLVFADRLDHAPEARMCEPMQAVKAGCQRGERDVVEREVAAQIDAQSHRGALAQAQALVAPVGLHRVHEEEHHLRER